MPALIVLATADSGLADSWARQLPADRITVRFEPKAFSANLAAGLAAMVILDATVEKDLPPALQQCPTIFVGEPRSLPYEQARLSGRAKAYLSYEDSASRLGDFLSLVEELAEKQSMFELLVQKTPAPRRRPPARRRRPCRSIPPNGGISWRGSWKASTPASRSSPSFAAPPARSSRLRTRSSSSSRPMAFARTAAPPLCPCATRWWPISRAIRPWSTAAPGRGPSDPVAELSLRTYLSLWGARLVVPIHDNGHLLGLIALGVRQDGQPYDEADRARAISFARLLRHFLAKSSEFSRLRLLAEKASLGAKYLPSTLVLGPEERVPREVPLAVRDLIGQVRHGRESRRIAPDPAPALPGERRTHPGNRRRLGVLGRGERRGARFRGVRERADRRVLLREIGLTLSHEVSNGLVSLTIVRQLQPGQALPPPILATARADVTQSRDAQPQPDPDAVDA